jgi:cysteinyl-tRNA synthetase
MIQSSRENGGDPDCRGKKNALDFIRWQPSRPGGPEYQTELGIGRPGWHIGRSVMSRDHLPSASTSMAEARISSIHTTSARWLRTGPFMTVLGDEAPPSFGEKDLQSL